MSLLLIVRDVLMMNVGNGVLLMAFVAIMATLPFSSLVSFVFFLIPLTCGIPGYMMLVAVVLLVIKGKSWTLKQIVPFVLVTLLEITNELGRTPDTIGIMSFLSFVAVFFFILNMNNKKVDNIQNIFCFIVGVVFTFAVIYFNMLNQYGLPGLLTGYHRSGALGSMDNDAELMMGHLAANANTIAYYAICAISTMIISMQHIHDKKWLMIILAIVCFLGGILTFSRTYIFCIALFLFLYFIFQSRRFVGKFIIIGTLLIMASIIFFGDYIADIMNVFTNRAEEENITTGGGRTELFSIYNKLWFSDIFYVVFGCGAVGYWDVLKAPNTIHCGMQQIWVCLGVLGFFLFAYELILYIKHYLSRQNMILLVPFVVSFVFDQSVQFLNPYSLLLPILPTLTVCQLKDRK